MRGARNVNQKGLYDVTVFSLI